MSQPETASDRSAADRSAATRIAEDLRAAILKGRLMVDERLPGEQELAERFGVSRPTVREALKRLAAQDLIRTRRGATGGSFVNRITQNEAQAQVVTAATLMVSMAPLDATTVAEARRALLAAAVPLACDRRAPDDLAAMRAEVARQRDPALPDTAFCDSDVRFHRLLADAAGNPLLSLQLAGVIEAVQPLFNMITYRARDRAAIADRHERMTDALEARDAAGVVAEIDALSEENARLIAEAQARRAAREAEQATAARRGKEAVARSTAGRRNTGWPDAR